MRDVQDIKIPLAEFRKMLALMVDRVRYDRVAILLTKNGRPVAKLVALDADVPTHQDGSVDQRQAEF